jgi:hypothetical protein
MTKILFLHHSTGMSVWLGKSNRYLYKLTQKGDIQKFFARYNQANNKDIEITETSFPKSSPYGWNNYPYDYYNIWVKNAGEQSFMEEPTLEMLTKQYDVIIFKHCFPVSRIAKDTGVPDINSGEKRLENYKLQYNALKNKMHEFPDTRFIVWTPVVCTKNQMTEDEARRTYEFYDWMTNKWKESGDNIYLWDYYKLQTEGSLYLLDGNASHPDNSHPNAEFSSHAGAELCKFIVETIE